MHTLKKYGLPCNDATWQAEGELLIPFLSVSYRMIQSEAGLGGEGERGKSPRGCRAGELFSPEQVAQGAPSKPLAA